MKWKNIFQFISIFICILLIFWYTNSLLGTISQLLGALYKKFAETDILNPLRFYFYTLGIDLFLAFIISVILDSFNSSKADFLLRIILTVLIVYAIIIGPLIMISFMILLNVSFVHITIVFAIMTFIGVCLKKIKNITKSIYKYLKDYI